MTTTVPPGAGRVHFSALGKHLQENPGTQAMRVLRESLIKEGIPLDKLTPTPSLGGSHDAWVGATDPEQKLKEYMRCAASTDQYSSSRVPALLAQATMSWLRTAQHADGTLDRDTIARTLGPRAAAVFDGLVTEMNAAVATSTAPTGAPPANMLGANAKSPDRGNLQLAAEVVRRLPFRMGVDLILTSRW
jgi:hypothetical protein